MLRPVHPGDLPVFFEHQRDGIAAALAAFPSRERAAFDAHWAGILANPDCWVRTVEADGAAAGYVCAFQRGERWEIAYWIGREFWGRGIASRAVAEFLALFVKRPLFAAVAEHNQPSLRVLEKAGFRFVRRETGEDGVVELLLILES